MPEKPVALAGVMGGFDTMITEATKNVLIESAWFDPATVRSMAKRHGMHTDASHRFERGADWSCAPLACDRVAELILASAGGELQGELIDTVARKVELAPIVLHRSEVKRILGIEFDEDEIQRILGRLGFGVTRASGGNFSVQVPAWRLDVEREVDLLEELARVHGYNKFPNTLPAFTGAVVTLPDEPKDAKVRETMLALGYDEAISITFISEQEARTFGGGEPLAIANPQSEEAGYMRTSMLPGLLNMVGYNLNRGNTDVRLFEAGEVFEKRGDGHDERRHLGFAATGDALAKSVHSAAQPYNFFHMKGDVEELLAGFAHNSLYFDTQTPEYFHPGRSARAVMDGETVARFGQLHPDLAAARKFRQEVYVAEVLLDRLYRHGLREPRYQPISKFPAVERDFSFVFDDAVTFERIKSAVDELEHSRAAEVRSGRDLSRREGRLRQVFGSAPRRVSVQGADVARRRGGAVVVADYREAGIARRRAARVTVRPYSAPSVLPRARFLLLWRISVFFSSGSSRATLSSTPLMNCHRLRRGESPRNLQRLVDHDRAGGLGKAQKLSHARAQQVAVHRGHALHPPALRVALDNLIDLRGPFAGNAEQLIGKGAHIFVQVHAFAPEGARAPPRHPACAMSNWKSICSASSRDLRRLVALLIAGRQSLPVFATFSRSDAISTAVRPASNPLLPAFNPARSMACSSVSQVRTPKACGTPVSCADWPMPRVTSLAMTS